MKKEISIIIPCYNVEKYITRCLDSVSLQLKDFKYEIILVNDKSTDNTDIVIKKYMHDNILNINYINNEQNIGAGASRNKAIKEAKYDYISFIDADDYLSENYYEKMFDSLINNKADVVLCDITMVDEETKEEMRYKAYDYVFSKYNIITAGLAASPCNKIIKKKLLIKNPFEEGIMNEDVACILPILAEARNISYCEDAIYYYVQHHSSVQNSPLSDKKLDIITAVDIFLDKIKDNKDYDDFRYGVVFSQILAFLFYVPIREKNIINRGRFLRKFGLKSKHLDLRNNPQYWNFLSRSSFRTKLYYKVYMKLVCNGFGLLASLWIAIYDLYKLFKKKKTVIKENIELEDIVNAVKTNQKSKCNKTVSVAIPNYNYSEFLYQRLYSIFNQKYKINELIFLDDKSTDNSIDTFEKIYKEIKDLVKVKKIYNEKNSGAVFRQWKKAMINCESDYIWIAEADDYCDGHMLSSLMNIVNNNNGVQIAYVDTAFINKDGNIIMKTIKPEIDIMKTGHWNKSFVNDGLDEIMDYAYLNCTIANVSSAIFKNDNYDDVFDELESFKQVGDYLFYLSLMERGKIAFINKPLNYYRVHGNNVTSNTKKQLHFDELKRVHNKYNDKYKFNKKQKEELKKRYDFLKRVWDVK